MAEQETKTPDEIREEIEGTREQLADTVEALGAKTDVKGQAKAKIDDLKSGAADKVSGKPGTDTVKRNPLPFAVAAALLTGFLIGRRSGS